MKRALLLFSFVAVNVVCSFADPDSRKDDLCRFLAFIPEDDLNKIIIFSILNSNREISAEKAQEIILAIGFSDDPGFLGIDVEEKCSARGSWLRRKLDGIEEVTQKPDFYKLVKNFLMIMLTTYKVAEDLQPAIKGTLAKRLDVAEKHVAKDLYEDIVREYEEFYLAIKGNPQMQEELQLTAIIAQLIAWHSKN